MRTSLRRRIQSSAVRGGRGWILLLALAAASEAGAQTTAVGERPRRTIQVEWATDRFDAELPFYESFNLRGPIGDAVDSVRFSYAPFGTGERVRGSGETLWRKSPVLKEKEFLVPVGELEPNVPYRFQFIFYSTPSSPPATHPIVATQRDGQVVLMLQGPVAPAQTPPSPPRRCRPPRCRCGPARCPCPPASEAAPCPVDGAPAPTAAAQPAAAPARKVDVDTARVPGIARAGLQHHFDADIGVMYATRADYWGVVTNAHIHAVPVNRNRSAAGLTPLQQFAQRASIFVGLAVQPISSGAEVKDLYTVGSPVVGVGYRGLFGVDQLRLNGGVMFFKQEDANPLVTRDHTKRDAFVSATVDFSVQSIFGPLLALIR